MMRSFTGESLRTIAFPLGGIGTGTVALGGRGNLQDWEIFNRPGKGKVLPYTFFCIYAGREGEPGIARVLERRILPPYQAGFGLPTAQASGLPRLHEVVFRGEYPFAWLDFQDARLPLQVQLEACNPLIPLDAEASGLPAALFRWTLTHTGDRPVQATVAFNLLNPVGYDGVAPLNNRHHMLFGSNLNQWREEAGLRGIFMSSLKYPADSPLTGTVAISTTWPDITLKLRWERAGWWDDLQNFWDDLTQHHGMLSGPAEPEPSPDGQTDVGTLGLRVRLEPGQSATLPFYLTWHFPNLTNTWNRENAVRGRVLGNWYATRWQDAWDVARYLVANHARLDRDTRAYHRALYHATLPAEVIDAVGAGVSILRTPTVLRTADGRMNAFEGCGESDGCCPMNCTHVWNYAQTAAFLFPELERSARLTDLQHNTRPSGEMAFRTLLPLIGELWAFKPAADGQMGTILRAYREWLQSGDLQFLQSVWPGIRNALEFAWRPGGWDADCDGVLEGEQHNTYDIEFYGPNTLTGTLYLGALRAAEEMAQVLGEVERANRYREVFESGRQKYVQLLWNGEYFRQIIQPPRAPDTRSVASSATHPASVQPGEAAPRYQYGEGCLSDQLLGAWLARVVGLEDLLPAEHVRSTLAAIFRYNWRPDLTEHASVQRVYAVNDEPGLLLCTWPRGGRPSYPFPYADEVWTGIEYQVAAHCLYAGLIEEGLAIVRGVRSRYDGAKRNPWDECECGHHYARALSSWSLLLALSGYHYAAHQQHLAFAPVIHAESFRCFFSAGTAWGVFAQIREPDAYAASVTVLWGELSLRSLALPLPEGGSCEIMVNGQSRTAIRGHTGSLVLDPAVTLSTDQALQVFWRSAA
ncbi:MAG: GH116 family glycosyl-hydrolase [Chloroherpetonaceae bacterium]|nr:non-lysosomal glucosylceramidase [Chthonomonadaceae bacterium]MDW8208471.1 GH116 family glycosyl-hydrolase [Chloroherpetonaceae bacterium]